MQRAASGVGARAHLAEVYGYHTFVAHQVDDERESIACRQPDVEDSGHLLVRTDDADGRKGERLRHEGVSAGQRSHGGGNVSVVVRAARIPEDRGDDVCAADGAGGSLESARHPHEREVRVQVYGLFARVSGTVTDAKIDGELRAGTCVAREDRLKGEKPGGAVALAPEVGAQDLGRRSELDGPAPGLGCFQLAQDVLFRTERQAR